MKKQVVLFTTFLAVAAAVLMFGHIVLYITWTSLFNIPTSDGRTVMKFTFIYLALSFPVTSFVVFWKETRVTNALYAIASTWLGLGLYITAATVIGVLVDFTDQEQNWHLHGQAVTVVLLAIAVTYTIHGIWNAYHPVVRRITVRLPNLPAAWEGQRIVQLSDMHLGPIHRQRFAKMVVRLANAQQPAAVFVTGDLFDGGGRELHKLAAPLNDLRSTHGTFFITGNHETYVGLDRTLDALKDIKLTMLEDRAINLNGIQLLGISYPPLGEHKDYKQILSQLDRTKPNILLYHEPKHLDIFSKAGVNLLLAGHTHVGQLWPLHFITHRVYGIYDMGLHAYEQMQVYTSTGVGTWGPPLRTGNMPEVVVITLKPA
jgi:uncharacterized protein